MQLSQTSVSVPEGNSGNTTVNMCVGLTDVMGGLQRNVVVNITTQDGTASKFIPYDKQKANDALMLNPQWLQTMIISQSKINH